MALIAETNVPESCVPLHAISMIDRPTPRKTESHKVAHRRNHKPETSRPSSEGNIKGPVALKLVLQPFLAGLTDFDALAPLRV